MKYLVSQNILVDFFYNALPDFFQNTGFVLTAYKIFMRFLGKCYTDS